jgi:hypothetical protein
MLKQPASQFIYYLDTDQLLFSMVVTCPP